MSLVEIYLFCVKTYFKIISMPGKKNHERIQPLDHFLGVYYRIKNEEDNLITRLEYKFFILQGHFSNIVYISGSI
jgi:hypothetical protein